MRSNEVKHANDELLVGLDALLLDAAFDRALREEF